MRPILFAVLIAATTALPACNGPKPQGTVGIVTAASSQAGFILGNGNQIVFYTDPSSPPSEERKIKSGRAEDEEAKVPARFIANTHSGRFLIIATATDLLRISPGGEFHLAQEPSSIPPHFLATEQDIVIELTGRVIRLRDIRGLDQWAVVDPTPWLTSQGVERIEAAIPLGVHGGVATKLLFLAQHATEDSDGEPSTEVRQWTHEHEPLFGLEGESIWAPTVCRSVPGLDLHAAERFGDSLVTAGEAHRIPPVVQPSEGGADEEPEPVRVLELHRWDDGAGDPELLCRIPWPSLFNTKGKDVELGRVQALAIAGGYVGTLHSEGVLQIRPLSGDGPVESFSGVEDFTFLRNGELVYSTLPAEEGLEHGLGSWAPPGTALQLKP